LIFFASFTPSILQVVTELGDKLVTRVPREADLEVQESEKPRMIPIPVLGISKQWGKMTVKRVWTKVTVGYGLDGVMLAVNKDLPELVEVVEEEGEGKKKKKEGPEEEGEKEGRLAGAMDKLLSMGQKAREVAGDY
jgi:hypothetical protein